MSQSKKDLQIICNIKWKTKSANGGNRVNVVGFWDLPATTLSWEHFKSYLLTNSGISDGHDDIRVMYTSTDGRELIIQSQIDFQIALYTFRRLARMGEMVNITLDRISDHKSFSSGLDTKAQFDIDDPQLIKDDGSAESPNWLNAYTENSKPPKWFTEYMQVFKRETLDEVHIAVNDLLTNLKTHFANQSSYHLRKSKSDSKRSRKHSLLLGELGEKKDMSKLERKLETKLEKLEHKTKKIKEKKLALSSKSSGNEEVPTVSFAKVSDVKKPTSNTSLTDNSVKENIPISDDDCYEQFLYHGIVLGPQVSPHLVKGEVYKHTWDIYNDGTLPWDDETQLRFTWGSKSLLPVEPIIACPPLKPKQKGKVSVQLIAPSEPGNYECYWHLYHKGKRFGDWFGCQVIVGADVAVGNDAHDTVENFVTVEKNVENQMANEIHEHSARNDNDTKNNNTFNETTAESVSQPGKSSEEKSTHDLSDDDESSKSEVSLIEIDDSDDYEYVYDYGASEKMLEISSKVMPENVENIEVVAQEPCKLLETENSSIKGVCQAVKTEGTNIEDDNKSRTGSDFSDRSFVEVEYETDESKDKDMVFISIDKGSTAEGYAYVLVDGKKVSIPKKFLRQDFLETAEDAPVPHTASEESSTQTQTVSTNVLFEVSKDDAVEKVTTETIANEMKSDSPVTNEDVNNLEQVSEKFTTTLKLEEERSANSSVETLPIDCTNVNSVHSSYVSHCSAAGSCCSDMNACREQASRLFIFPQDCPGYEIVSPYPSRVNESGTHITKDDLTNMANSQYRNEGVPDAACYHSFSENLQSNHPSLLTPPLSHCNHFNHVPNYQQTYPNLRQYGSSSASESYICQQPMHHSENVHDVFNTKYVPSSPPSENCMQERKQTVHILPETLVTGAVNVASSAINTARSVINMIVPREEPGTWVNGHWIASNPETPRETNLRLLAEMGFYNRDLNATLLARYNDDIARVVSELIQ